MAKPLIEAVTDATLKEFATFLAQNMTVSRSVADWIKGLKCSWTAERPNYGFALRDGGKIVGGIGAIYADRVIRGQTERFCNITSWCVQDAYRQQSMRLAMTVLAQPGYHFTDFSPTRVVGGTLRFLKFKPIDDRQAVIVNLPLPSAGRVLTNPKEIEQVLTGDALRIYQEHAVFPWLKHMVVGDSHGWCHVIYKRTSFKDLPAARVVWFSDAELFDQHFRRLAGQFFLRGMVTTLAECRSLKRLPPLTKVRSGFSPKVYLSTTLAESDIDYLFSETAAFDLD